MNVNQLIKTAMFEDVEIYYKKMSEGINGYIVGYEIGINQELPIEEKVKTLIHELIHYKDPRKDEDGVEFLTCEMFRKLNMRQYNTLKDILEDRVILRGVKCC